MDPSLERIRGGLLVSCQADPGDPLRHPEMMAAMAKAAELGGAVGLRASGVEDIRAIRAVTDLPIIGIYKADLPGYAVRITPTIALAEQVAAAGAHLIAVDATNRPHPDGYAVADFIVRVGAATGRPVLADCATFAEGVAAAKAGAAAVLTTLSGYTADSASGPGPDFDLIARLADALDVPVIAEGRIATPEQAGQALRLGAWAVVVGSAITRPRWITERFAAAVRGAA